MDTSIVCLSCKFETINRIPCLSYLQKYLYNTLLIKPAYLYLPKIIHKFDSKDKRIFLNAVEHFYFCEKGCTANDITATRVCQKNHPLTTLFHEKKKYKVFHIKENYYRLLNGTLWYVTQYTD